MQEAFSGGQRRKALEKVGRADLELNQKAREAAAKTVAPDKTVPEALALATADKPAAGEVVALGQEQVVALRKFLESHHRPLE